MIHEYLVLFSFGSYRKGEIIVGHIEQDWIDRGYVSKMPQPAEAKKDTSFKKSHESSVHRSEE